MALPQARPSSPSLHHASDLRLCHQSLVAARRKSLLTEGDLGLRLAVVRTRRRERSSKIWKMCGCKSGWRIATAINQRNDTAELNAIRGLKAHAKPCQVQDGRLVCTCSFIRAWSESSTSRTRCAHGPRATGANGPRRPQNAVILGESSHKLWSDFSLTTHMEMILFLIICACFR